MCVIPVDHERLRGGCGIGSRTIGTPRSDEGGVSEQDVVLDGEVVGGGDGDGVPERAREVVAQDCARVAGVLEILIAEPSSRSNRNTDPVKGLYVLAGNRRE